MWVWFLGQEVSLEEEMATYSSILTWKIPWEEEAGGLQFMGLQRVRHNWMTEHSPRHWNLCMREEKRKGGLERLGILQNQWVAPLGRHIKVYFWCPCSGWENFRHLTRNTHWARAVLELWDFKLKKLNQSLNRWSWILVARYLLINVREALRKDGTVFTKWLDKILSLREFLICDSS